MLNTRENFKTNTQYKRWLEYYEFFSKLIEIQKTKTIWIQSDGSKWEPLDKFEFRECKHNKKSEWHIVEFCSGNKNIIYKWVGSCHHFNSKTDEFDLIHIEESLTKLINKFKFKTYENEVFITKD
jgi:hypothetical protein